MKPIVGTLALLVALAVPFALSSAACTKAQAVTVGPQVGTVVVAAGCELVSILDPLLATTLAAACPSAQTYVGDIITAIIGLTSHDVATMGLPETHLDPVDVGGGQTALVRRDLVLAFRAEAAKRGPFVLSTAKWVRR